MNTENMNADKLSTFTVDETDITLDEGLSPDMETVRELIREELDYQICHPMRICKDGGTNRFTRVPLEELKEYEAASQPVNVLLGSRTATLYPMPGRDQSDITADDIVEFVEIITEPIFIGNDGGKPYVGM